MTPERTAYESALHRLTAASDVPVVVMVQDAASSRRESRNGDEYQQGGEHAQRRQVRQVTVPHDRCDRDDDDEGAQDHPHQTGGRNRDQKSGDHLQAARDAAPPRRITPADKVTFGACCAIALNTPAPKNAATKSQSEAACSISRRSQDQRNGTQDHECGREAMISECGLG